MDHMVSIQLARHHAHQQGLDSKISDDGKWLIIVNLYQKEVGKTLLDEHGMVSNHALKMIFSSQKAEL